MTDIKRHLACNALFIAVAVALMVLMPYQVTAKKVDDFLGPRFFINVAIYLMLAVNIVSAGVNLYRLSGRRSGAAAAAGAPPGPSLLDTLRAERNTVLVLAVLVATSLLMPAIGYLAAGAIMNVALLVILKARKWYYYAIALGCLVATYVLFYHFFYTMLP